MDREGQTTVDGRALAEQLGRVGLWTRQLDVQPAKQVREAIAELEELGWGSLWFWEVFGREALTSAGLLLCATRRMVVASGIANMWTRDPVAMAAAGRPLVEAPACWNWPQNDPPARCSTTERRRRPPRRGRCSALGRCWRPSRAVPLEKDPAEARRIARESWPST